MEDARHFKFADSELISFAGSLLAQAKNDFAVLTQFDHSITLERLNHLEQILCEVQSAPQDKDIVEQLSKLTAQVHRIEEDCVSVYRKMRFFVQRAFKGDLKIQNEFGINDYESSTRTLAKHVAFMREFASAAQNYREAILACGATQELIESIVYLSDEFEKTYTERQTLKQSRHDLAHQRVEKLNFIFSEVKFIAEKAEIVLSNSLPAAYVLPGNLVRKMEVKIF
jgi:hypothetical protein